MQLELQSLIQTVHKTSINIRNSEAIRALAREARATLIELLRLYNNPKTRDQATDILISLGRKAV